MSNWTKKALAELKPNGRRQYIKIGVNCYFKMSTTGVKTWVRRFQKNNKKIEQLLGEFHTLTIREALALALDKNKISAKSTADTFAVVAERFVKVQIAGTGASNQTRIQQLLANDILPALGDLPIDAIVVDDWIALLENINQRGSTSIRERARALGARIIRWAYAEYPTLINHPERLAGYFRRHIKQHYAAAIAHDDLAQVMQAIAKHNNFIVRNALLFQAWSMLRPGSTCKLKWSQVDFKQQLITLDGHDCKYNPHGKSDQLRHIQKQPHLLPLASHIIELLKNVHTITGRGCYVFAGATGRSRRNKPLSASTMTQALKSKAIACRHTAHGFRATARTILEGQLGFAPHLLEIQLGHMITDANGRAYNRNEYLAERSQMMQQWSDYLHGLIVGKATVVAADFRPVPKLRLVK